MPADLDCWFERGLYWQSPDIYARDPSRLVKSSRASIAYQDDLSGNWTEVPYDIVRVTDRGALTEETRTNIIRNNSMQGAVAGSPGVPPTYWAGFASSGLETNIVGVGQDSGIDHIDIQMTGTTIGGFYVFAFDFPGTTVSSGEMWTESFWAALVAGSLANIDSVFVNLRWDVGGMANTSFMPTSKLTRYNSTGTVPDAAAAAYPAWALTFSTGVAIDLTLRIGWPQLERGAFVTSPIRTIDVALARAADNLVLPSINLQTMVISAVSAPGVGSNEQVIWQWDDGTESNRIRLVRNLSRDILVIVTVRGEQQHELGLGQVSDSVAFKIAAAWTNSDFVATLNGGTLVAASVGDVPSGLTTLRLGSDSTGNQGNVHIMRCTGFAPRISDLSLQELTRAE